MSKMLNRLGEKNIMKNGQVAQIIRYKNNNDIDIEFEDGTIIKNRGYQQFKKGNIVNPYYPVLYGVGFLGNTKSREDGEYKKSYLTWRNMLSRCYNKEYHKNKPTYINCEVCKEWHCFEIFEKWYKDNIYTIDEESIQLDKDIMVKGNKIYSPDTCIFTPSIINCLFVKCSNNENSFLGVNYNKKYDNYYVRVNVKGKKKHVGVYNTKEEAFIAYKQFKENYIKSVADEYKDKIPKKLYDALYNWKVEK